MNEEFYQALEDLEKERGIPKDYMLERVKAAMKAAYMKEYPGTDDNFEVIVDEEKSSIIMVAIKTIVETVTNSTKEISYEAAKKIKGYEKCHIGDKIRIRLDAKKFGRLAAQTAKNVIIQGIREADRNALCREYSSKEQEILATRVYKIDSRTGAVILTLPGKNEEQTLVLTRSEQIPGETYTEGQHLNVYLVGINKANPGTVKGPREPQLQISRKHPGFVRKLFESEVPEIYDGSVELVSVAREAGSRTKIAVKSNDESIDAIGACVGPKSQRVNAVVNELNGEKIDIIKYSENVCEYVSEALSPATVISANMSEDGKVCEIKVPTNQLSLAIGKEGQNARLAAKLTGCKIDIKAQD